MKEGAGMVGYDLLTEHERGLVDHLAYVWNQFNALPVLHPGDKLEFLRAIHAAQNIVCSRPYLRQEASRATAGYVDPYPPRPVEREE